MTRHTWRHVTFWLLHLGVFWLTLPSLTADLNTACQSYANKKFQIRAMTYTKRYFYLVSSDGQLFVEDVDTFLDGIYQTSPTIKLNRPIFSLSTKWYGVPGQVDYANTTIQFGFTNDQPDDPSQEGLILRMINYVCLDVSCLELKMCFHKGFRLKDREEPSSIEEMGSCKNIQKDSKAVLWLNEMLTMYPIFLKDDGPKMKIYCKFDKIQNYILNVHKWNTDLGKYIGTFKVKPQSGLLTEPKNVQNDLIFFANEDSTGHFLSVDRNSWFSEKLLILDSKQLPLSEVIKLQFCQIKTPREDSIKDSIKDPIIGSINRADKPPNRKILYLALAGTTIIIVLALSVYAVMKWQKKKKKKSKKRDKGSKTANFWSSIGGLLAKVSPCKAKKKRKEILMSKVRESIMLASMATAASNARQSSRRRKKGSKVGPRGRASPRWAVSGVLTEMQKGLLSFKALMRQPKPKRKPFSMASTASTASKASTASTASKASLASLASLPAETQSIDYHFNL